MFNWKGGSGNSTEKYFFDINENLDEPIQKSGVLDELIKANNNYFEIDSNCPNSSMLPSVRSKIKKDSLLNNGTWAYLGSASNKSKRYLFWTSVNTDTVGANRTIPVIISTADNKFYVSETTTAVRNNNSSKYVTIAEHLTYTNHQQLINDGTKYNTLKDAYDAYAKLVTEGKYQNYKDTLPKS